jgi:hypothetical protein
VNFVKRYIESMDNLSSGLCSFFVTGPAQDSSKVVDSEKKMSCTLHVIVNV